MKKTYKKKTYKKASPYTRVLNTSSNSNAGIVRVNMMKYEEIFTDSVTGGFEVGLGTNWAVNLQEYTTYSSLYRNYRVARITVVLVPSMKIINCNNFLIAVAMATNRPTAIGQYGLADYAENGSSRLHSLNAPISCTWKNDMKGGRDVWQQTGQALDIGGVVMKGYGDFTTAEHVGLLRVSMILEFNSCA